jgi:hypothetical protein
MVWLYRSPIVVVGEGHFPSSNDFYPTFLRERGGGVGVGTLCVGVAVLVALTERMGFLLYDAVFRKVDSDAFQIYSKQYVLMFL